MYAWLYIIYRIKNVSVQHIHHCSCRFNSFKRMIINKTNLCAVNNYINYMHFILSLEQLSFDDLVYIADKLQNEVINKDMLCKKLGFEEGLKAKCFDDIDSCRIPFVMILEWKRWMKRSDSNKKKEASKKALARSIMKIAESIKDLEQKNILQTVARKLDICG